MSKKNLMIRTAAAAAATVLMTVGATAPALAEHDGGNGKSNDGRSAAAKADQPAKASKPAKADKPAKANNGRGAERGNGHTPVTVCHLLGNGTYNVLTFDDNALTAHRNHGDIYPVPADGCPESSEDGTTPKDDRDGEPGHVRVTVCHLLGNGSYNELTFDEHALGAHQAHGDLYPVPAGGCPVADETSPEDTAPGAIPGTEPEDDDTTGADTTVGTDDARDAVIAGVGEFATTPRPGDAQILGVQRLAGPNRAAPATGPLAGVLPQTGAGQLTLALVGGLGLLGAGAAMVARRRSQGAL